MSGKKITKADIIDKIYERNAISRKEIHEIVDSFMDEIKNAMVDDSIVELRGFGTFELRLRKGRKNARNPKTDEIVSVDSHYVAVFRPGKDLKQAVWNAGSES